MNKADHRISREDVSILQRNYFKKSSIFNFVVLEGEAVPSRGIYIALQCCTIYALKVPCPSDSPPASAGEGNRLYYRWDPGSGGMYSLPWRSFGKALFIVDLVGWIDG